MKVRSPPLAHSRRTTKKMVEDKLMICQGSHSKQGTQLGREGGRERDKGRKYSLSIHKSLLNLFTEEQSYCRQ